MTSGTLFLVNLAATWYMVGLIWMVQIVHYRLFDRVGRDQFVRYEADHGRLITPVVGIPMLVEIATSAALVFVPFAGFPRWAAVVGLGSVVAIWISTAFLQVPCHQTLAHRFDERAHRRLVRTNWIRTGLWSARGLLLGYFACRVLAT